MNQLRTAMAIRSREGVVSALLVLLLWGCGGEPTDSNDPTTPPETVFVKTPNEGATPNPKPEQGEVDDIDPTPSDKEPFEGSTGKLTGGKEGTPVLLREVRTGFVEEYERIVFDFGDTRVPSYEIEYKEGPVHQCGSGEEVHVRGEAVLQIVLWEAQAHTPEGKPTITKRHRIYQGHPAFAELELACDFESMVDWILGVKAKEPVRVMELDSPARLVVDVKNPSE